MTLSRWKTAVFFVLALAVHKNPPKPTELEPSAPVSGALYKEP